MAEAGAEVRAEAVLVTESAELPITTGNIDVDTSQGPVTLVVKPAERHEFGKRLIITKVSTDQHAISLLSEGTSLSGADIVMFGLPDSAKSNVGKNRSVVLISDGQQWLITVEK